MNKINLFLSIKEKIKRFLKVFYTNGKPAYCTDIQMFIYYKKYIDIYEAID